MTANEAIAYIENYSWSTTRLGLERTRALLAALADPQKQLKFIHVAGSNGKGSTCAMLDAVLRAAGYRTGLYTSPYIEDFCERIQVNGENIPGERLAEITERVKVIADTMEDYPSQFELVTAIAMEYYRESRCDIVVLEVGLGGALDSTNAIDAPEAAVITNIGLEHTEYLGNTLEEIALAKAGIIKEGCSAVCYDGANEVTEVIKAVCKEKNVPLTVADFSLLTPLTRGLDGQSFLWRGERYDLALIGEHQLHNAALALVTIEALRKRGWRISAESVREGLTVVKWPARFEVLNRAPLFILDGGHNPQCAEALAASLDSLLPNKKAVFLTGVLADKDYERIMALVSPYAQEFVCLTPLSDRALSADALAEYLVGRGAKAIACDGIENGIVTALTAAGEGGAVVAFGSLYLAGAVRRQFAGALKKWLRAEKINVREGICASERNRLSEQIVRRIAESKVFKRAKTVLVYHAVRGEASLEALVSAPEAEGKRFAYPRCVSDTEMVALLPRGECGCQRGSFDILEPDAEKSELIPPEDIDMAICPCTAFDETGARMGMGGGFYDRFLPKCKNAEIAAVAFEAQKVKCVPTEFWDVPMEIVFTEKKTYMTGRK